MKTWIGFFWYTEQQNLDIVNLKKMACFCNFLYQNTFFFFKQCSENLVMSFVLSSVWTSKINSDYKGYFSFAYFELLWFSIFLESMIYYGDPVISFIYKKLRYLGITLIKNETIISIWVVIKLQTDCLQIPK